MLHGEPMDRKRILIPPERIRRLNDRPERSRADYVLYWVQMYQRAEQNWALTAAIEEANRLALPLVVYQGLGHTYPQANDRLHRFILEGSRTCRSGSRAAASATTSICADARRTRMTFCTAWRSALPWW